MKPIHVLTAAAAACAILPPMSAETDYRAIVPPLEEAIRREMTDWDIGGVAIALTDGTRVVHAAGFGEAQVDSIFRAGSISKLFNAVAVMQLVEAGRLDLDAPLASWPGATVPTNPFRDTPAVTLRQLLSHRSGLQRESPVGSYLDPSEPTLAATCASVADGALATPPAGRMRYSNIAPSIAGHVVAIRSGLEFADYQRRHILGPLGMERSAWLRREVPSEGVIVSRMRIADASGGFHRAESPLFDLGTIPAGNLFSTAPDLANFLVEMARAMRGESTVLRAETMAEMWKAQIDPAGSFGIGFSLGRFRGHRTVGHNGAVYGHSTALVFLPESQLGVVVLANDDIINARVGRLADTALALMLEAKTGEKPPAPLALTPANPATVAECAGRYESQSFWAELRADDGRLVGNFSSQPCTMVPHDGMTFMVNSRLHAEAPAVFLRDAAGQVTGFSLGPQSFVRVPERPAPIPDGWRRFMGSYGPDFIPTVVHEKFGRLYATTENMLDYRLTPVNRHVFALPPGLYTDEFAVFLCDADGHPHAVDFASMLLPRN